jgi:hypothetical protein
MTPSCGGKDDELLATEKGVLFTVDGGIPTLTL